MISAKIEEIYIIKKTFQHLICTNLLTSGTNITRTTKKIFNINYYSYLYMFVHPEHHMLNCIHRKLNEV